MAEAAQESRSTSDETPAIPSTPDSDSTTEVARFLFAVHEALLSAGLATLADHGAASLAVTDRIAGAVVRTALVHMARPCRLGHVGRCAVRPRARQATTLGHSKGTSI